MEKKYEVKVLQIARDDVKSIAAYIGKDNPNAAMKMANKIIDAINKLADFPFVGAIPTDKIIAAQGYRMLIVKPYLVFYIVIKDNYSVEIHRVIYSRREYADTI